MSVLTVIAEAGVNHNGDLDRARDMVRAAAAAGADYIKFQAFAAEDLAAAGTATAAYQSHNTGEDDQRTLLESLEIGLEGFTDLAACCREQGIGFMATAFDVDSLDALIGLGMDRIKIASGELTNAPALDRFAVAGRPILLSTGMATMEEVAEAVKRLTAGGAADVTLLQCTSLYPAPAASLNLRAMVAMAERFGLPVGFSDHSLGDHAAIAAVALGACVIEKHFTLDRSLPGPDHAASLEPEELAAMITRVREAEVMLGDGTKAPVAEETATAAVVRRSWHAARDLEAGSVIGPDDVVLKRPANGLPPVSTPVDRTLGQAVAADAPIRPEDLALTGATPGTARAAE